MTTTMTDLQTGRSYVFNEALPGRDAYEEALAAGFVGDRDAWLAALRGFMFNPASADWEIDRTYRAQEAVRHANKLWVAATPDTGTEPGTDAAVWVLLLDGPDPADVASVADDAAVIRAAADQIAADLQTSTTLLGDVETKRGEVATMRDLTYGYTQDAASAVAYQNLASLAASKAETAVDVLVYDTTRDSDGGAWRNRCQSKSWYTETLNTATRGSRREFPAVAVIVATASALTIYDGDDPALPMWMVFSAGFKYSIHNSAPITSVAMLNGELRVGVSGSGTGSISEISFLSDKSGTRVNSTTYYYVRSGLSQRNALSDKSSTVIAGLVNRDVNDIAMTVLPGAPTDPATGLPVPTIAVATAGGVSVIASSGAVYDSSKTTACTNVVIDQDGRLRATFTDATSVIYDLATIAADGFTGTTLTTSSTPAILGTATKSANAMLGSTSGITLLAAGGWGSARITSAFNTGWMPGDIKGAWLASKDTTSLVGGTDTDRTHNAANLSVTGTITCTAVATGADLVGYGGFSAANYLSQAYRAALDFGTTGFAVLGWIKEAPSTVAEVILERDSAATGQRWTLSLTAAGYLQFTVDDNTTTRTATGATAIDTGVWWHVAALYDGAGGVYVYLDGVLHASATGAALLTLNNASAVLRLGLDVAGTAPLSNGTLALWRITATVPTADQIAKIYADEAVLFQANAAATLYGGSDAVTGLAHDKATDLLHVGTSAGRSTFSGLRRVANTTTPVTTAIAASGGLIMEQ